MITTYPNRVPTFVLAQEIQAPLRRLALRRQHVERVERVQTIQAAVRRAQCARRSKEAALAQVQNTELEREHEQRDEGC
jgi:uncharacterized protein YqeY